MEEAAEQLGANAVVGIDLDYENITFGDSAVCDGDSKRDGGYHELAA